MICSLPLESDDVINMDCSGTIKLLHILRSVCVCVYIYTSEAINTKQATPEHAHSSRASRRSGVHFNTDSLCLRIRILVNSLE